MTTYKKPSDVLEAVGVSGVLSAGLSWHVVGEGLAWAEFDKPADAVRFTMTKKGKGRKFAVMAFTPGEEFSGVVYLTNVKRGLDAGQVVSEGQLLDLYHGQEEKPAAKTEEKKPAKKAAKDTGVTVVTLDHKKLHIKPAKKEAEKQAAKKAVKTNPATTGLQFGPALVSDKEGKITISSLLYAGKAFASHTVPAEFSARFKKYSEDNQLLLYLQGGPDLGQVATYRGWLKQGRQVSKGQHGLKILAPRMVVKDDGTKAIDGLRLVTLFSINQTEKIESQEA
ncbi:ArdC family protein [Lactobacillus delbrueckii subsp. allosunkii]|uniref:ArdC family protein n=1 Tax=Lactobacillus delbrueckii TaxID=1584 RepID=UPI003A83E2A8